jgi:hypothetical protein
MKERREKCKILRAPLKLVFLTKCQEWCHLYTLPFFTGKSERADILDIETTNDDLSFQIIKSKIKVLADAGLIGPLADPLLTVNIYFM